MRRGPPRSSGEDISCQEFSGRHHGPARQEHVHKGRGETKQETNKTRPEHEIEFLPKGDVDRQSGLAFTGRAGDDPMAP
jgi:hypothetical protein